MSAAHALNLDAVNALQGEPQYTTSNWSKNIVAQVANPFVPDTPTKGATVYSTKDGKVFPDPEKTRDQIRTRIGAALRMALHERYTTREEIISYAKIDRRTLDNWINGYCDPSSWRIAVLGEILGTWFWMHVYGGDVGMAMYRRMQDRMREARTDKDLAAAVDEVERRAQT